MSRRAYREEREEPDCCWQEDPCVLRRTRRFEEQLAGLPAAARRRVERTISILLANPAHPSLQAHRLLQAGENIWGCYVTFHRRLIYRREDGGVLTLLGVGEHDLVRPGGHLRRTFSPARSGGAGGKRLHKQKGRQETP